MSEPLTLTEEELQKKIDEAVKKATEEKRQKIKSSKNNMTLL